MGKLFLRENTLPRFPNRACLSLIPNSGTGEGGSPDSRPGHSGTSGLNSGIVEDRNPPFGNQARGFCRATVTEGGSPCATGPQVAATE